MSIIKEVASRLGATDLCAYSDSNGYQGCTYYILKKNSKYTVVSLHFGTCAVCDWAMGLQQDWLDMHPSCGYSEVPLDAYEPIIASLVDDANETGFHSVDILLTKFDMIFGSGYYDTTVRGEVETYLRSNP